MTVSSTTVKKSYNGNGSTAAFTYDFLINTTAELKVIIRSSTGTETVKTLLALIIIFQTALDLEQ